LGIATLLVGSLVGLVVELTLEMLLILVGCLIGLTRRLLVVLYLASDEMSRTLGNFRKYSIINQRQQGVSVE